MNREETKEFIEKVMSDMQLNFTTVLDELDIIEFDKVEVLQMLQAYSSSYLYGRRKGIEDGFKDGKKKHFKVIKNE